MDIEKVKELHAACMTERKKADEAIALAELFQVKARQSAEDARAALRKWRQSQSALGEALELGEPQRALNYGGGW